MGFLLKLERVADIYLVTGLVIMAIGFILRDYSYGLFTELLGLTVVGVSVLFYVVVFISKYGKYKRIERIADIYLIVGLILLIPAFLVNSESYGVAIGVTSLLFIGVSIFFYIVNLVGKACSETG
jgi:hypothetical protein